MPFAVDEFLDSFSTELARPSRFEVFFNIPQPLVNNGLSTMFGSNGPITISPSAGKSGTSKGAIPGLSSLDLALRCESAQLPSRTLMTTEQKIYGITEKYPYENSYNDAEFVFMLSGDMREKKFFDSWINFVSPKLSYNMNYKSDYATSIVVRQYDVKDRIQYEVELRKAFPITVNQLDLDWSADGYHKLTVVFAYSDWISGNGVEEYVEEQS
jgi:hypothetical protein